MTDFASLVDQVSAEPPPPSVPLGDSSSAHPAQNDNTPPSQNKFANLVDQVASDHQSQAQAVNASLQGTDADKMAKATELGQQFGLPPQAIMPNIGDWAARAQLQKNNQIIQNNPALAKWVASDPPSAAVAQDDFDHLDTISKLSTALVQGVGQADLSNARGLLGNVAQVQSLVGSASPQTEQQLQQVESEIKGYSLYQPAGAYGALQTGVGAVTSLVEALAAGTPEAAAGSIVPGVGTAVGLTAGSAGFFGATAAGNHYADLRNAVSTDGKPMPEYAKQLSSVFVGGVTTGLGLVGMGAEGDAVAAPFINGVVKDAMMRPTVVSSFTNFAKSTATAAAGGAAMMGSFTAASQLGQEIAKQISPGDWQTILNDPQLRQQYHDQLVEAIASGAAMFAIPHSVGSALAEYGRYTQAQRDVQTFNQLADGSAASKTRQRSPDAFQSFMANQTNGTPAENVFVPAAKVMELYQSHNVVPGANDGLLGKAVPDIADQIAQAAPRGGDVVIPTSAYAARVAGTPVDAALRPDIRVSQDGMSLNEAKAYQADFQNMVAGIGQEFDASQEAQGPARAIYANMQQKAEAAGFTTQQSAQYAALTASRYVNRANRLGLNPLDLYREQGIDLRRGVTGEAPEAALGAGAPLPVKEVSQGPVVDAEGRQATEAYASDRGPIPASPNLAPEQRDIEARFADYLGSNFEEAKAKYDANPESQQGRVVNTDTVRELSPDYLKDRAQSSSVHEPASWFTKQLYSDKLKKQPPEGQTPTALFTAGGTGAGKSSGALESSPADIIYDSNMNTLESSRQRIQQALDSGRRAEVLYVYRDPVDALVNGALPRAMRQEAKFGTGRTVPIEEHLATHVGSRETILKLLQEFKDDPRVQFMAMDNSFGKGNAKALDLDKVPEIDDNGLGEKLYEALDKEHQAGRISDAVYAGFSERADLAAADRNGLGTRGSGSDTRSVPGVSESSGVGRNPDQLVGNPRDLGQGRVVDQSIIRDNHFTWQAEGQTKEQLLARARKAEPAFAEWIKGITADVDGAKPYGEGVGGDSGVRIKKSEGRIDAKIEEKGGPEAVSDYLGGAIEADTPQALAQVIERIGLSGYKILESDDMLGSPSFEGERYPAVHLQVELKPGFSAELQIFPSGVADIKQELHGAYVKVRDENGSEAAIEKARTTLTDSYQKAYEQFAGQQSRDLTQGNTIIRGKITLAEGKKIITLFEKADKSTFLHEMGHLWLEELRTDALRQDAPDQLKSDWEAVKKSIGQEGDGKIAVESHERFARSFEQYLMEGKAPSNALLGSFRRFKQWLTNIYKTVGGLGVKLNDETREVFDRMLATDDEIAQMERRDQVNRLFKTADQAGMSDKEFAAYNATATNAEQSAREQLLAEAVGDLRKRETREWKAAEEEIRPDIEKHIEAQHDIRTLDYFRTGKLRDEQGNITDLHRMTISRDALQAMHGGGEDGIENILPAAVRKSITAKGGLDPDDIAPFLGYDSGKAMVDDMLELGRLEKSIRDGGSRSSVNDYLADQEVNRQLHDKFGLSDAAMRERAEEMASNPDRMDLKLAELRALGRKSGQRVSFTKESIKAWAQDQISGMKAKDAANVFNFVRAMAKAGRDAERAVAKGDDKTAFQALQRQALNMAMAREAREAEHLFDSTQKEFKRLASKPVFKSIDQDYLDQLHGVLRQFGYSVNRDPVELRNALSGANLSDFLAAKNDEGRMLSAPDFLLDGQPKTLGSITKDQLRELSGFVDSMLTNARDEKNIMRGEQKASFDQLKADLIAQRRPGETINKPTRAQSDILRRGGAIARIFAEPNKDRLIDPNFIPLLSPMRRVMDYMQALDNDKTGGAGMETLWQPLSDAADKEAVMRAAEKKAFDDFRQTLPKGWEKFLKQEFIANDLVDSYTGEPSKFTGAQAMGIALNIGNASNLDKMLRGEHWDEAAVRKFLDDTLDKHHWDTVQFLIDRMESHWPETEALYKKLNGIAPTKIKATPIETRFGTYPGGYFPIIFDPIRATDEMIRSSKLSIDGNVSIGKNLSFMDGMTSKGRTITRTNVAAPLLYDLNAIMPKMNEAIHDLAFREAIINANKFLGSRTVSDEISQRLGQAAYTQLGEGVRAFARPYRDDRSLVGVNRLMQIVNQRAVQVGVMFRPSTIVKHFSTMLFRSFTEISPQWMLHGFRTFYGSPMEETAKAYAEAPMLKFRMDQVVTDMRQGMASLQGESTLNSTIHQVGHYGIGLSDQATALPIYIAGRDKAISEGKTQDQAVAAGKQAVLDSHGGSRDVDLPALLRTDNQYLRAVTLFYSIMNHAYNRGILRTAREIRYGAENVGQGEYGAAAGNFAGAFARTLGYFILPGMAIGYFLGNKKDDESWAAFEAKAAANEFGGTLPGVRSVADAYFMGTGKDISLSPIGRMADTVLRKSPHEAASALGLSNAVLPNTWLRDTLDTTAYMTGAPVGGQPAQTAQFLWDYAKGYQNPNTVQDWVHGLMHGTTKSRQ